MTAPAPGAAAPHLVRLAFVVWPAVLLERCAPATLHRFLAAYVRATTHAGSFDTLRYPESSPVLAPEGEAEAIAPGPGP